MIEARNATRAAAIARCNAEAERILKPARHRVRKLGYVAALRKGSAGRARVCRKIDAEIAGLAAEASAAAQAIPDARRAADQAGGLSLRDIGRAAAPAVLRAAAPYVVRAGAASAVIAGPVGWVVVGGIALYTAAQAVDRSKAASGEALVQHIRTTILDGAQSVRAVWLAQIDAQCDAVLGERR